MARASHRPLLPGCLGCPGGHGQAPSTRSGLRAWPATGPPARIAAFQWLARPQGMPPSSGWTARKGFHFQWAVRDLQDLRDLREVAGGALARYATGSCEAMLPRHATGSCEAMLPHVAISPCEAREPIPGANHLPGALPVVSEVPEVPVAGSSPAKRLSACLGHRQVALPLARRLLGHRPRLPCAAKMAAFPVKLRAQALTGTAAFQAAAYPATNPQTKGAACAAPLVRAIGLRLWHILQPLSSAPTNPRSPQQPCSTSSSRPAQA